MNIGIDIRPLLTKYQTGVGEFTRQLLTALFKLDKTNHYFLFYNVVNAKNNPLQFTGENIFEIKTNYPNKLLNLSLALFDRPRINQLIIKKSKQKINSLDFYFSPNFNFTSISKPAKHILLAHDLSFEHFPEFYTAKQRLWHAMLQPKKQCQQAHLILTPSQSTKNDIIATYKLPAEKIKVLSPGVKPLNQTELPNQQQIVKQKYQLSDNFILYLGAIEPRKNITSIIAAYEKIAPQLPTKYQLIIAGPPGWKNNEIYSRANASSLKDKIKFLGFIKPEEKQALISLASLFVFPSFYEGFGFPILEAMQCGVPVIASNRASLPEVAQSAAWLVNPNNPADIANGIKNILLNSAIKNRLVQSGIQRAQQFTWEKTAQEFLSATGFPFSREWQ